MREDVSHHYLLNSFVSSLHRGHGLLVYPLAFLLSLYIYESMSKNYLRLGTPRPFVASVFKTLLSALSIRLQHLISVRKAVCQTNGRMPIAQNRRSVEKLGHTHHQPHPNNRHMPFGMCTGYRPYPSDC